MALEMINSSIDVVALAELARVLPYKCDTTGVLMYRGQGKGLPNVPELVQAAEEIATIRGTSALHLMVNVIPPKLTIPKHIDQIPPFRRSEHHEVIFPHLERWHLPLASGSKSWWWDEDGYYYMLPGRWYGPVKYWKLHSVGNDGDEDRIHLIVDLTKEVASG